MSEHESLFQATPDDWCAHEGCHETPVWIDPDNREAVCPKHVNPPDAEPLARQLPSGQTIDLALWLRVRASLLLTLMRLWPTLTDGQLADAADAACEGFVAHALDPGFRQPYSEWYAKQVVGAMRDA